MHMLKAGLSWLPGTAGSMQPPPATRNAHSRAALQPTAAVRAPTQLQSHVQVLRLLQHVRCTPLRHQPLQNVY